MASASVGWAGSLSFAETGTNLGVPSILPLGDYDGDRLSAVGDRGFGLDCILELEFLGGRLRRGD